MVDDLIEIEEVSIKEMAIIGMALTFPDSSTPEEFWNNLRNGKDSIGEIPDERKRDIERYMGFLGRTDIVFEQAAYLKNIDQFDYAFFGLSPKEASLMDPNQRMFLETCWRTIEDAGYGGDRIKGSKTGVYMGFHSNLSNKYAQWIADVDQDDLPIALPGNVAGLIPSRIAYLLDLRGPTMLIDTTCSSTLVALHLACQGIRNGDCEMALVGGGHIDVTPVNKVKIGIESTDGRAKTFDERSDGTGSGEGVAAILIKPLHRALADGDQIYAVIKGSAINQDGNSVGITAPNSQAQAEVIVKAWQDAGIDPETISYIEAHGTGTKLGDPVEIDGIERAFRQFTDRKQFCGIGSLKTNIGHLDTVAGLAGLIKATLALKYKELPPTLHFEIPNKKIAFEESPVYVNKKLRQWEQDLFPRRCGVSSFGLSGTNVHVVLEEAPAPEIDQFQEDQPFHILTLSAKSENALNTLLVRMSDFIETHSEVDLADLCYTANVGRGHYQYRLALIFRDLEELKERFAKLRQCKWNDVDDEGIYYGVSLKEPFESVETNHLIEQYHSAPIIEKYDIAKEICQWYVKGEDVSWVEFYQYENRKIISLPTYPFDKHRCWLEIELPPRGSLFEVTWNPDPIDQVNQKQGHHHVLIFKDDKGIADQLIARFHDEEAQVIEVTLGQAYKQIDPYRYVISGRKEDYEQLLREVKDLKITQMIHMLSIGSDMQMSDGSERFKQLKQRGVNSLFYFIHAFLQQRPSDHVELVIISEYVNKVISHTEQIIPENAALFGLGKVIGAEYSNIKCRAIDIDDSVEADLLWSELKTDTQLYQIAYRRKQRFVESITKSEFPEPSKNMVIKDNGLYLITGGTGGIGLEIAKYLASKAKVKVALMGRTAIPDRHEWPEILAKGSNVRLCKKIKAIEEIEQTGATVICLRGDVADQEEMAACIRQLREKYGKINGVIHAAGIAGDGFLIRKDEESFQSVLAPKMEGTWIVDQLTREDDLDFFVMFSSINSLLGEPGQSDYTAANAFLDAYAVYRNQKVGRTFTINWPPWKETGMAVDYGVDTRNAIFKAISTEDAINMFDRLLHSEKECVIVGELNHTSPLLTDRKLPFLLAEEIEGMIQTNTIEKKPVRKELKEATLLGKSEIGYTEVEQTIAKIWRNVLGFEEFDVTKSFFELGGDSVLLIQVHAMIEEYFPGKMTVVDLFTYTTISDIAAYISKNDIHPPTEDKEELEADMEEDFDQLLEEMETGELSLDKALEKFKAIGGKNG